MTRGWYPSAPDFSRGTSVLPTRISVAPSSTATRQSWEVPIESSASPCARASSASRRNVGRLASGSSANGRHRHQPAQERVALAVALDLALGDAALRRLAGEVDLEQPRHRQPARGRVGVDRVDELAELVHDARLVRLQGADEVPAERVAVQRVLALQVLGAVLARRPRRPASARTPMSSAATYFVAATTVTPGPASAQTASYASRTASAFTRAPGRPARAASPGSLRAGSSTTSSRSVVQHAGRGSGPRRTRSRGGRRR